MSNLSSINCAKNSNIFYLSNCDLINKYNLTALEKKPKIKNVIIELSSRDILNSIEISGKTEISSEIQIKSFFTLYVLNALIPFISFSDGIKVQAKDSSYSLKVVLSNDEQIYSFLLSIFVENWNKLLAEDFLFWPTIKKDKDEHTVSKSKKILISRKLPAVAFFGIDNFLSKNAFGFNAKALNLNVKFKLQNDNLKSQDTSIKLIKNTPLFWISG